jgi:lysophospholipase L1-like esterase
MLYNPAEKNELHGAVSTDGGVSWQDAGTIEQNPDPQVKVGRPVAVRGRDGTLWIFYYGWVRYTKDPKTSQNDLWVLHSTDNGKTWSGRRKIWSGYAGMLQGAIETSSGTLVLPFCYLAEPTRFIDGVIYSRDRGKSWTFVPSVIDVPAAEDATRRALGLNGGALEPTITQLSDGRLWLLTRTITGKLWQSYSTDDGKTWTRALPSYMTCGGVLHMTRLQSGLTVLVWNQADWSADWSHHFPWNFRELSIAFTEDGVRWQQPLVVARGPDEVHSFVAEVAPGKIMITLPKNGMLVGASETVLRNSQQLVAYDSPSGFFKYGSHPFAPQTWSQLFFYDHANDAIPAPSENPRVVFMGDSITDFWHLERNFPGKDFINRGISGQITPQMLLRFMPDVIALKPKVVVILGGTNDIARGANESVPNTPTQMTRDSIRAMTELAQKNGIAVVLCSIPPVSDYSGVNRTKERPGSAIKELNDWLRAYKTEARTAFADYFGALRDETGMLKADFSRDGVHPNDAGYAAMAPVVSSAIEEALRGAH